MLLLKPAWVPVYTISSPALCLHHAQQQLGNPSEGYTIVCAIFLYTGGNTPCATFIQTNVWFAPLIIYIWRIEIHLRNAAYTQFRF